MLELSKDFIEALILSQPFQHGVQNRGFVFKIIMTKEELFEKYSINESHNVWDNGIDNWYSVEVYRIMHDGNLPPKDDLSVMWVCDFLDKQKDMKWWVKNVMSQPNWGSLYLTAKRMVHSFHEAILKELNK